MYIFTKTYPRRTWVKVVTGEILETSEEAEGRCHMRECRVWSAAYCEDCVVLGVRRVLSQSLYGASHKSALLYATKETTHTAGQYQ